MFAGTARGGRAPDLDDSGYGRAPGGGVSIRRLVILIVLVLVSAACSRNEPPPPAQSPAPETTSSVGAQSPAGTSAGIPDPCTLLSDTDVTGLTGRDIIQVDRDGDATASTRYCQWQQSGGQLALFVTRTAPADFTTAWAGSPSLPGIGDDAYWRDCHLFVLVGTIQLDVYASGGDDQQNQAESEQVAEALLPKVRGFS
ncbi:DUF3558 family protein [Mycobacterium sp. 1274761.0]|uniref:DUF3558 family protein n=1 Tax=Mycobacterium sp. 1274761.0 TaxID=1834077 RepID=UPI0007FE3186|nr:DUF3558 family protein [Mycobacterium sp. 1274761.0]OBK79503.1 hypothetical protein A5651_23960 [Mycobacterium sp. 1274761.0]